MNEFYRDNDVTIYNGDSAVVLQQIKADSVDLVVTSPPYDNLRNYNGYCFDFSAIAKRLYSVIRGGGILVWIVGDAVVNGSETGTSFKQALEFMNIGFRLHDTMIYEKNSSSFPAKPDSKRYTQIFEYMFIFCKGKIRNDIALIADKKNIWQGCQNWGKLSHYSTNGMVTTEKKINPVPQFSLRNNIWKYNTALDKSYGHPAIFPEKLAIDHILSWSKKGDIVLDPFCGSGTTAVASIKTGRKCIGIEISQEYCNIIKQRCQNEIPLLI